MDPLLEALEIGIRGYVLRSSAVTDIADGVRRVAGGEKGLKREQQKLIRRR
jgi:DNA-binding NarL/FixJ family response regulator